MKDHHTNPSVDLPLNHLPALNGNIFLAGSILLNQFSVLILFQHLHFSVKNLPTSD